MSSRGRRRKRGGNANAGGNNGGGSNGNTTSNKSGPNKSGSNKAGANKAGSNKSGSNKGKGGGKNKGKQKAPKFDAADFWGDNDLLPDPRGYVVDLEDSTAILRSLGRPPIPGSEAAAEHHFVMVYERSVNLAKALAAAGGLDQEIDDTVSSSEPADIVPSSEPADIAYASELADTASTSEPAG